jgi:hypothetical protein
METFVNKSTGADRNQTSNASSQVQYSSMSNANASSTTPQITLPQPAPMIKAAKPVRDSAQFVS